MQTIRRYSASCALAFAAAPVATEAKVPMVVMAAGTQVIPQRSPFIVRTGFTLPQTTAPIAGWAYRNGIKRVFTLVTDYAPGLDSEKTFLARFKAAGGEIVESMRTPLRNPASPFDASSVENRFATSFQLCSESSWLSCSAACATC